MRHWLFHPLIFYPLAALFAGLAIAISLKPQSWPREPAPVSAQVEAGALILDNDAFNSPTADPGQTMTVVRDFLGRAQDLRIAVLPGQEAPSDLDQGVRILLSAENAALLTDRPVTIDVSYNPLPVNAASSLAVSLQGSGPAHWVAQQIRPQPATVRFRLPAQSAVNAIGLRAISGDTGQAFGLEITRIRVVPRA